MVPNPSAVLAAEAEEEFVPPFATDIGVVIDTDGFPSAFKELALISTPVANEVPSVTVAVIVPITQCPSEIDIAKFLLPRNV